MTVKMVRLYVFLIVLICTNCSRKSFYGDYIRSYEYLQLNIDSTYYYEFRIEQPESISHGKWKILDDDKIILNSTLNYENIPLNVTGDFLEDSDSITFYLKPETDFDPVFLANFDFLVCVNNKLKLEGLSSGIPKGQEIHSLKVIIFYKPKKLPIISASRDSLISELFYTKSDNNNFEIGFPLKRSMLHSFTVKNDTLILKRNKVLWKNMGNAYFKKIKSE